jgi:hypothetical protein
VITPQCFFPRTQRYVIKPDAVQTMPPILYLDSRKVENYVDSLSPHSDVSPNRSRLVAALWLNKMVTK